MNNALTSFRALAVFAVFLFHSLIFNVGYLGVQAFFVLSGFLLTPILIDMKSKLTTKDLFIKFYARRSLRIFPLYFIYLFVLTVLVLFVFEHTILHDEEAIEHYFRQLPWALTYTYNFYHASNLFEHSHLLTHFWSLAVEEQFYLLWPLIICFCSEKHYKSLLVLMMLAGPFIRALIACLTTLGSLSVLSPDIDVNVYVLPFSHFDAFATGGFFALFIQARQSPHIKKLFFLIVILGMATELIYNGVINVSNVGYGAFMKDAYKYIWGYSVLNVFFAWMLVHIQSGQFMAKLLNRPWMIYLGTISYGLYVFHFPAIWVVNNLFAEYHPLILLPTTLLLSIVLSSLSYALIEKRFIEAKDKFFNRNHH